MVADHVEERHLADGGPEERGPLRHRRAHEEAAVAAAHDGEAVARRVPLLDQEVGGGEEIVEHVLLVREHALAMPVLTVLASPRRWATA